MPIRKILRNQLLSRPLYAFDCSFGSCHGALSLFRVDFPFAANTASIQADSMQVYIDRMLFGRVIVIYHRLHGRILDAQHCNRKTDKNE